MDFYDSICRLHENISFYTPSSTARTKDLFPKPLAQPLEQEYSFWHYALNDNLSDKAIVKILKESVSHYRSYSCLVNLETYKPVRLGDIILRINRYNTAEAFGKHLDISLATQPVMCFSSLCARPTVTFHKPVHFGEQARLLAGVQPQLHKFNGNGEQLAKNQPNAKYYYSVVVFLNGHYSEPIPEDLYPFDNGFHNIGSYLTEAYYMKQH